MVYSMSDDAEETLSNINEVYGYRYDSFGTYGMREFVCI